MSRCGVGTLKLGDSGGFTVEGEARDKHPEEHLDVDLSVEFDDVAFARSLR